MFFLVGSLRTIDMQARCDALACIFYITQAGSEDDEFCDVIDFPRIVERSRRPYPRDLEAIISEYGKERCATWDMMNMDKFRLDTLTKFHRDPDLCELGRTLAGLSLRTDFMMTTHDIPTEHPSFPFKPWLLAFPVCAIALRQKNQIPADWDYADILEITYLRLQDRILDAIAHAQKAIQRNPEVAYFYYVIGSHGGPEEGLKTAKKGAKAKFTSLFLHYSHLGEAVTIATPMGIMKLAHAKCMQHASEGIAMIRSALADATEFLQIAPPDTHYMPSVVNCYVVLKIAMHGPELRTDLRELQVRSSEQCNASCREDSQVP